MGKHCRIIAIPSSAWLSVLVHASLERLLCFTHIGFRTPGIVTLDTINYMAALFFWLFVFYMCKFLPKFIEWFEVGGYSIGFECFLYPF